MAHNKNKSSYQNTDYNDEYDDDEYGAKKTGKKKQSPRRRPVRNWKKAWTSIHDDDLDDTR